MYKSEHSEFSDKLSIVYHYYCALNEEDLEEFSQDQLIAFAKAMDQLNPFKLNGLNLSIHQKLVQRSANNLQKFINRFPNFKLDLKRFENSFHKGEHEKQFKATPQQNNVGVSSIECYEDIVSNDKQTSREKATIEKTGQSTKISQSKTTPQNKPQEFDAKSAQMKDEQSEAKNNQEEVEVEEDQQPRQQQEENKLMKKKVDWNETSSQQDSFDEQDQQQKQAYLKDNKPVDDSIDSFEDNQEHHSQSLGKQSNGVQAKQTETKNQQTSNSTRNQQTQEKQLKHKINSVISGYSSNEVKHHYRYADQMHQNQNNKTAQNHHAPQEENSASKKPAQNPKQQQDNSSEKQQDTSFLEEEDNSSEASYDIDDSNFKLTQQNPPSHVPSHGKDQFQEEDEDDVDFQEKLKKVKQMHKINFQTHKKTYQTLRNQWNQPKHPNPGQNQNGSDSESLSDSDSFQEKQKRLANRQFR